MSRAMTLAPSAFRRSMSAATRVRRQGHRPSLWTLSAVHGADDDPRVGRQPAPCLHHQVGGQLLRGTDEEGDAGDQRRDEGDAESILLHPFSRFGPAVRIDRPEETSGRPPRERRFGEGRLRRRERRAARRGGEGGGPRIEGARQLGRPPRGHEGALAGPHGHLAAGLGADGHHSFGHGDHGGAGRLVHLHPQVGPLDAHHGGGGVDGDLAVEELAEGQADSAGEDGEGGLGAAGHAVDAAASRVTRAREPRVREPLGSKVILAAESAPVSTRRPRARPSPAARALAAPPGACPRRRCAPAPPRPRRRRGRGRPARGGRGPGQHAESRGFIVGSSLPEPLETQGRGGPSVVAEVEHGGAAGDEVESRLAQLARPVR